MPDKAHPLPAITCRNDALCPPRRNSRPNILYPCLERSERSMNDSDSFPEEEEQRYRRRQREKSEQALRLPKRTKSNEIEARGVQATEDKNPSSPSLKIKDQVEPAIASRPELPSENQRRKPRMHSRRSGPPTPSFRGCSSHQQYRPIPRPTPPLRLASGCSLDGNSTHSGGSSVQSSMSRSAPVRRTPIPREPSLYRPGDSRSQRDFSYTRDALNRKNIRSHSRSISTVDNSVFTETVRRTGAGGQLVSIAPGVEARLRGTKETYDAVGKDFYANVSCFGCCKELCCIADVSCVICPDCRVISPLEGCLFEGRELRREGLGLGFTYDCLFKMQTEIMKKRRNHY